MVNTTNPDALGWKHPGVGGIRTRAGVITNWPGSLGPMPNQATVDGWETEYEAKLKDVSDVLADKTGTVTRTEINELYAYLRGKWPS